MIIVCLYLICISQPAEQVTRPKEGDDLDSAFSLMSVRRFSACAGKATLIACQRCSEIACNGLAEKET